MRRRRKSASTARSAAAPPHRRPPTPSRRTSEPAGPRRPAPSRCPSTARVVQERPGYALWWHNQQKIPPPARQACHTGNIGTRTGSASGLEPILGRLVIPGRLAPGALAALAFTATGVAATASGWTGAARSAAAWGARAIAPAPMTATAAAIIFEHLVIAEPLAPTGVGVEPVPCSFITRMELIEAITCP
jgi:hypothetical protein